MRLTMHLGDFTITVIVKKRKSRHSGDCEFTFRARRVIL